MDPNTKIKFSRNGIEIGEFKLLQVEYELKLGTLKSTDHYWYEGMTQWEPVPKLLQLIDKAKKEQLAKAQKEEEIKRQKYAAKRDELERNNYYKCGCCRVSFEDPEGMLVRFTRGTGIILLSCLMTFYLIIFADRDSRLDTSLLSVLAPFISILLFIIGLGFMLSAFVRAPSCPKCGSSNFAKPEKPEPSPK